MVRIEIQSSHYFHIVDFLVLGFIHANVIQLVFPFFQSVCFHVFFLCGFVINLVDFSTSLWFLQMSIRCLPLVLVFLCTGHFPTMSWYLCSLPICGLKSPSRIFVYWCGMFVRIWSLVDPRTLPLLLVTSGFYCLLVHAGWLGSMFC